MKKWIAIVALFFIGFVAKAQYENSYNGPDRYFYDEEFDWRWDIRVRISDGFNSGFLTKRESNRLYRILEGIERKEWAFQSDGYYSVWEQDEIWMDVVDLNRRIGLELTDWDRRYYGYTGVAIRGSLPWYFGSSYDFYRFDRRGYGTIHVGYAPRTYHPVKHVYYTHQNNYYSNWNNARADRRATHSRVSEPRRVESGRTRNMRNTGNSRISTPRHMETGRVRTSTSEPSHSNSSSRRESSRARTESHVNSSGGRFNEGSSRNNSFSPTRESSRVNTPSSRSSRVNTSTRESSRVNTPSSRSSRVNTSTRESSRVNTPTSRSSSRNNVERSRSSRSKNDSSPARSASSSSNGRGRN